MRKQRKLTTSLNLHSCQVENGALNWARSAPKPVSLLSERGGCPPCLAGRPREEAVQIHHVAARTGASQGSSEQTQFLVCW